jgi:hypothetical protein
MKNARDVNDTTRPKIAFDIEHILANFRRMIKNESGARFV